MGGGNHSNLRRDAAGGWGLGLAPNANYLAWEILSKIQGVIFSSSLGGGIRGPIIILGRGSGKKERHLLISVQRGLISGCSHLRCIYYGGQEASSPSL